METTIVYGDHIRIMEKKIPTTKSKRAWKLFHKASGRGSPQSSTACKIGTP